MKKSIEERVTAIENRNNKVESDKAWETSWARRLTIGAMTYGVAVAYLLIINNEDPWLNALVPAGGYILSTLVVKTVREYWESRV